MQIDALFHPELMNEIVMATMNWTRLNIFINYFKIHEVQFHCPVLKIGRHKDLFLNQHSLDVCRLCVVVSV